jgi:hypothetical protein
MKRSVLPATFGILGLGVALAFAQAPPPLTVDFESPGSEPPCEPGLTGGGNAVNWQLLDDPTAPAGPRVLAETSVDPTNYRFPLCIFPDPVLVDVGVSVAFKPVAGSVDQAAGVILRAQDENNYYIARANALEGNVRFYKVENGQRVQLAGSNVPVLRGEWQTLELRARGNTFEILLNGTVLFSATDSTFPAAGRVGLWIKADSLTYFDQFVVTPL